MDNFKGDGKSFDANWKSTPEANYLHWVRGKPLNQIQLAFRQHWLTFNEILNGVENGAKVLEVGCGRGSLSAYFADEGCDCTLLDISPKAIDLAKTAFSSNKLNAEFDVGDCMDLQYPDNVFDLCFSIGLLEHFTDIETVISEQLRVLKPGGMFIGYVVPEMQDNVQKEYDWICDILQAVVGAKQGSEKTAVFRSDSMSDRYLPVMENLGMRNIQSRGTYPLPMISHSIDFPFSLLPAEAELILTEHFEKLLDERRLATSDNPWLCEESEGQAFLVWGSK